MNVRQAGACLPLPIAPLHRPDAAVGSVELALSAQHWELTSAPVMKPFCILTT